MLYGFAGLREEREQGRMRRSVAVATGMLMMVVGLVGVSATGPATADVTSFANDGLRTGWYPDQPGLSPASVSASDFGKLFSSPVTGEVYAQPLVSNNTLLVETETNDVYGFDPQSGTQKWTRHLHAP